MRRNFVAGSIFFTLVFILLGLMISKYFLLAFIILLPIIVLGLRDMTQSRHALLRIFPVLGHLRYIAEWLRPKMYQYFVEPDYDGRPFNRIFRSIIYQRAKNEMATSPFGTQLMVYEEGYEWMSHSISALDSHTLNHDPRVIIGGKNCLQPYDCSLLNVSAMSFGSLSYAAIEALNGGAALGGFAHNTGEGGISDYHDKFGGDLIYQIGTGYFGSRTDEGDFDPDLFAKRASADNVKMIEIKLSQGAKPGHGGILPAKKVSEEIARIRNVKMGQDVISPPYHKAFSTPIGLLKFIEQLRTLSKGKPIGFKLCVGKKSEFISICKAMIETGIKPDFIAVDGGEGGTGAAPLEFSDSVGMPSKDGLVFVYNTLIGFNIKKEIALISAGKIATGFHMFRAFALGADACYSARAMMMALGCIQALECNKNICPTGVATQDPKRIKGLVVKEKKERVFNYHKETLNSFVELMAAAGLRDYNDINRSHITRRIAMNITKKYDQMYPYIVEGSLLDKESVPRKWKGDWAAASADTFVPKFETCFIDED